MTNVFLVRVTAFLATSRRSHGARDTPVQVVTRGLRYTQVYLPFLGFISPDMPRFLRYSGPRSDGYRTVEPEVMLPFLCLRERGDQELALVEDRRALPIRS
jgi:hypothetical protein